MIKSANQVFKYCFKVSIGFFIFKDTVSEGRDGEVRGKRERKIKRKKQYNI